MQFLCGSTRKPTFTVVAAKSRSSPNISTAAKTFGYREFTAGCCDFML
jgi:hypothetical protein